MRTLLHKTLMVTFLAVFCASFQAHASSSGISLDKAVAEASALAAKTPGWKAMLGDGSSMKPHYGRGDVLLVKSTRLDRVQKGMMVVFRDSEGDLVGHTVVAKTPDGLQVRGVNNAANDLDLVTPANYEGVIVGVLHTNGRGDTRSLPVVLGKSR